MTTAVTVYERMNELSTAATALHASGFFSDVKTQAQAMVKVMAGAEIGLPPFASMSGIHIVQGKPVLGANLVATLVKNDPRYDYRVKQADNKACILTWYEGGRAVGESSFTWDEATAAGLTGKDNWRKYTSDMLFARALTRGARRYAPGIFGGAPIYTPDEMGVDTDEDGQIIEGQAVTVASPADPEPPAPKANGKPARVVLDVYPARTYGDGTTIPGDMTKSIRAFDAYLEAHGHAPEDYPTLKEWAKSLSDAPAQAAQAALVTVAPDTANGGGAYQE